MKNCIRIFLTITLSGCGIIEAETFSERDVIHRALSSNTELAVRHITLASQSLSLDKAKSLRLPQVNLSITPRFSPLDSSVIVQNGVTYGQNSNELGVDGSAGISQYLPGGGKTSVGLSQAFAQSNSGSLDQKQTRYSIGVSQPLLAGAWKHNPIDYAITLARFDHKKVSLQEKKTLLETLSVIRHLFWSCYEQKMNAEIINTQLAYTREQREMALQRFLLGEATIIDTLSTSIEELKIKKLAVIQKNALSQARAQLATALMLAPDSLETTVPAQFDFMEIPAADTLINQVLAFDPQIQLFSVIRSALQVQFDNSRNRLLPSLSAGMTLSHDDSRNPLFTRGSSRSDNLVFNLIFSYALPLRQEKLTVQQAALSQKQNELYAENRTLALRNQVNQLIDSWKAELAKLEISDATRQVARQQFDATRLAFSLGSVSRLEMLRAQADLNAAESDYVAGCVDMKRVEVVVQELTGITLAVFGVSVE